MTDINSTSIDIDRYIRHQRFWRNVFVAVLLTVVTVIVSVVVFAVRRAEKARSLADQQQQTAVKSLDELSAEVLSQIQTIDAQTAALTSPENPTLALWSGGLGNAQNSNQIPELIGLLNTRRFLLGGIKAPMLQSSPALLDYACTHRWFVIGQSVKTDDPDQWLRSRSQTDIRYSSTAFVSGTVHPDQKGLVVGWFLLKGDADSLVSEINKREHNQPFKRSWDFPETPCSGVSP